jgi:diaminohydroxyphosphoribosylaminopyrimidine deaminase / 5-amino-6-(5-phosphoribosylamino)uracil reductase
MERAIVLARRGAGLAHPNPMVGAVVVKGGRAIGEGFHIYDRRDHAEIVALKRAGAKARGAALYVSLEPCCTTGRTGPCTDAIIAAGVKRVYVAMTDPNPRVAGRGVARLRRGRGDERRLREMDSHGASVRDAEGGADAGRQNRGARWEGDGYYRASVA